MRTHYLENLQLEGLLQLLLLLSFNLVVHDKLNFQSFANDLSLFLYAIYHILLSYVKYILIVGLWVGWPGLHLNEMRQELVPEADPEDNSPTAGLRYL